MRRIFWGFCRNWFLIDPLHYFTSRSNFGFEFAEIFVIEKRLPDSPSQGVGDSPTRWVRESASRESMTRWLTESESRLLNVSKENLASRRVGDSSTRPVGESLTPRLGKSRSRRLPDLASQGVAMELLFIKLQHFKRLNQHFKGPI